MVSVIIAAHDEEAVIGDCIDALLRQRGPKLEIAVCANGCTDNTVAVAAARGVRVVERSDPGKVAALNAAETLVSSFPRIYLDADIIVPDDAIAKIVAGLQATPMALAAMPRRRLDTSGRPWAVRAYFAVNERLPVFDHGLFGRGLVAISEEGRARFAAFPDLIADDLFLDSLFSETEKLLVTEVEVVVEAPFGVSSLLRRLVRVRKGNAQLRATSAGTQDSSHERPSDRWSWARDVVMRDPRLFPAAVPYVLLTVTASALARREGTTWGSDRTTRARRGAGRTRASGPAGAP